MPFIEYLAFLVIMTVALYYFGNHPLRRVIYVIITLGTLYSLGVFKFVEKVILNV